MTVSWVALADVHFRSLLIPQGPVFADAPQWVPGGGVNEERDAVGGFRTQLEGRGIVLTEDLCDANHGSRKRQGR